MISRFWRVPHEDVTVFDNKLRERISDGKKRPERERENVQGSGGENNKRLRDRMCCGEDELSDNGAIGTWVMGGVTVVCGCRR